MYITSTAEFMEKWVWSWWAT